MLLLLPMATSLRRCSDVFPVLWVFDGYVGIPLLPWSCDGFRLIFMSSFPLFPDPGPFEAPSFIEP